MSLESPFVEASKRDKIISNISSMDDKDKRKFSHVWLAEKTDGTIIVQFDGRGNEVNYSKVRKALDQGVVEALFFVPVKAHKSCYGVKLSDVTGEAGLMRRGYKKVDQSTGAVVESGYVCRIQAGDKYLYFDGNGNRKICSDESLNVKTEVVDL